MLPDRNYPDFSTLLGTVAQPTSGKVTADISFNERTREFTIDFTLLNARVPVTDAAGSGSSGSLKLFDFIQSAIAFHGCRQDYVRCVTGAALDTSAGDAAYVWGVGTAAATAGDGTLTGTMQDIGTKTSTITNSGGTGAGTQIDGAKTTGLDGTSSAKSLYLNWSGTAATIDANSTIDVTGTITVSGVLLGDD
jgi:hypothetical protein